MQRKFFPSFTRLVRLLRDDEVTQAELDSGLFYFGCVRAHAMAPWLNGKGEKEVDGFTNELNWFFKRADGTFDGDAAAKVHQRLIAAVTKAEAEGRAEWRELKGQFYPPEKLRGLLARNGVNADFINDAGANHGNPFQHISELAARGVTLVC